MWNTTFGAFIKVRVFPVPSTVSSVREYLEGSPFLTDEVLINIELQPESTIFRDTLDNFDPSEGVEFAYSFTLDSTRRRGLTHLFINPGLLFRIDLLSDAALWEIPRYDQFENEMRAGLLSFKPPS